MLVLNMKRKITGFTLFEMLVVISIIGVLVAVMSTSFSGAQKRARDSKRVQDLNNVQKAAEQYFALTQGYPLTWTANTNWSVTNVGVTVLDSFPQDPKNVTPYVYTPTSVSASGYCLCVQMEAGTGTFGAACASGTTHYCVSSRQ